MKGPTVSFRPVFLILLLAGILFSCGTSRGGGATGKAYETFYIDQGVIQYFIFPQSFKSDGKSKFVVDYTLRDSIAPDSYIDAKFSMFTVEGVKDIKKLTYECIDGTSFDASGISRLFIDRGNKFFESRYIFNITYNQFKKTQQGLSSITVSTDGEEYKFSPTSQSRRKSANVNKKVIAVLDLIIEK